MVHSGFASIEFNVEVRRNREVFNAKKHLDHQIRKTIVALGPGKTLL